MDDTQLGNQLRTLLEPERTSIPDNGFSRRVVAMLPKGRALAWHREVIIAAMTLVGCLLGLIVFPGGDILRDLLLRLPNSQSIAEIPIPWLILVYVLCWTAVASALERGHGLGSSL